MIYPASINNKPFVFNKIILPYGPNSNNSRP